MESNMITSTELINKWIEQEEYKERMNPTFCRLLTSKSYWNEVGALFVISSRQTGKTTALKGLIDHLKSVYPDDQSVVVTPYKTQIDLLDTGDIKLIGKRQSNRLLGQKTDHLFVDEFMYIEKEFRDELLELPWKSVTMIGSMN